MDEDSADGLHFEKDSKIVYGNKVDKPIYLEK